MKHFKLIIALVIFASIVSCNDKRTPQVQYMPDMYESVPYDANGVEGIKGKAVNSKPVAGTIARGGHPAYDIPNTLEGYNKAKAELKNPLEATEANLENGKAMYTIYCATCHGNKGDGQGVLSQREKFEGIPRYDDAARNITEGSIYHVIMYGKNLMGSHASQLTYNERWQIVHYVEKLRTDLAK
ncbi:cytochrome c [uncultured Polaribacter sp.]|uniref:c-type cytochrome n=1 Tax=uncultured Polaribacter sp. TaxID=174711 RepID=UPI0026378341|nr:cytochrome c [uncultured Polaribacter sp.]